MNQGSNSGKFVDVARKIVKKNVFGLKICLPLWSYMFIAFFQEYSTWVDSSHMVQWQWPIITKMAIWPLYHA